MQLVRQKVLLLLFLLASTIASHASEAQERFTICDESADRAAGKLVGFSDDAVRQMGQRRAVGVPEFRSVNPEEPSLDWFAREHYLRRELGAALIIYAADDTHICAFLFKEGEVNIYARKPYVPGRFEELARELSVVLNVDSTWNARAVRKKLLESRSETHVASPHRKLKDVARDISELFLFPALSSDLKGVRQLSIVPIKGMSALPVALLEPFSDGRVAAELFSVNFIPFLADVKLGAIRWPRKVKRALIVGNPRPSNDQEFLWASLPGAEREAKAVGAMFRGDIVLRDHATKESVQKVMGDADLIYFAAHGYSNPRDPLDDSYIVLGDGRLSARQIQALDLHNRPTVILSACQTGEGQVMEAGIVGLARAFQIAQASNTVMSLWAVDDVATMKLMTELARRLRVTPPAEALREAMLALRRTDSNPAHWAAFNVFGNRGSSIAR
jgi:CHAT domain-containing protein